MKKKIYQVHRTLSLIIAIPVLLWAASGFMHPLMTNIRPKLATQVLLPVVIDSTHLKTDLRTALQKNHIDSFSNFRLVHIDTTWFYQVQRKDKPEPVYLSTINGSMLTAGDWLYAQYLARQFLEGQSLGDTAAVKVTVMPVAAASHDCCDAATTCVLNNSKGSKVTDASLLTAFDKEYKSINRLLPVYKVSFERKDGVRIYVETTQDRFAFAMDNKRAVFDTIFHLLHTWNWLDVFGKAKLLIVFLVASLSFVTTVLGIYIFFTTKSKKVKGNELVKARRYHRYTAIVAALFTLLWTFSGAYHALSKLKEDTRDQYFVTNNFAAADFRLPFNELQRIANGPVTNISIVKMEGESYWQVYTKPGAATYISTKAHTRLPQGDAHYARYLATQFSKNSAKEIIAAAPVTKFTDEYNFTDKRLPVWKVSYAINQHERYYVETTSGKLSVRVDDSDIPEGYSFSVFHKHHFMDGGGKALRDFSTMFWALIQVAMVMAGLILYFKWRKRTST